MRVGVPRAVICGPLLLAMAVCCGVAGAFENPVPPPPEVQTFSVTKNVPGGTVVLNWSDGSAPFAVERSESPNFLSPTNLTYVTRSTTGGPVSDAVLTDGRVYFYLVSDVNSQAQVYSITSVSAVPAEGDVLTFDGVGFAPSCTDNKVYLEGGQQATAMTCSPTQIQAEIPAHAVSGSVVVVTTSGQSTAKRKFYAVGVAGNPAFGQLSHINVDANHNIFACDQANLRIWKLDFSTGAASNCTSQQAVGNVVGLPRNNNGKFNFSADSTSSFSTGIVRELDPTNCTFISWGDSGTVSNPTDPVDPRALAYDKSGNNNLVTFVLDYTGDRIRAKPNGPLGDTMWLTGLGLGDNTAAASRPGGFAFNTAGEFFYTGQSTIVHRSQVPPRSIIQTFSTGLDHPAQLETDDVIPTNTLWVANKGTNNVLRVRTTPGNTLVRTKITGVTAPRGVALDRDPATNTPWVYVADQTAIYRFVRYDHTVHLDIKVFNETLNGIPRMTPDAFIARVLRDTEQARAIFTQCGIEIVVDRIIFIPDPNGNAGAVQASAACGALPTGQEQAVLGQDRSTDQKVLNVYYIHHFVNGAGQSIALSGSPYTNDCWADLDNPTQSGLLIARFGSSTAQPGGALTGAAIDNSLAHETGHFLLNNFVEPDSAGLNPEDRGISNCAAGDDRFYLMHGSGCPQRYTLTTGAGSECENILTNADEGQFFVESF